MPRNKNELLPGTLDLLVLKTVSAGPDHGYGIARSNQQASRDALAIEEGSLYPALHRMEVDRRLPRDGSTECRGGDVRRGDSLPSRESRREARGLWVLCQPYEKN